jgi:hypothetical protein
MHRALTLPLRMTWVNDLEGFGEGGNFSGKEFGKKIEK